MMGVSSFLQTSANRCRRLFLSSSRWKDCCGVPVWTTTRSTSTSTSSTTATQNNDDDPPTSSIHYNPSCLALVFDTETTHKVDFSKPYHDASQPDLVQLGMLLVDTQTWHTRLQVSLLVQPPHGTSFINPEAQAVHGISDDDCRRFGLPLPTALQMFHHAAAQADCLVAHNMNFDRTVLETALYRQQEQNKKGVRNVDTTTAHHDNDIREALDTTNALPQFWNEMPQICTMQTATDVLKLPGRFGKYKWPSLEESFRHFAPPDADMPAAHDALGDAQACQTVLRGLWEQGLLDVETIILRAKQKMTETTKAVKSVDIVVATANIAEKVDDKNKADLTTTRNNPIGSRQENKTKAAVLPQPGELQLKLLEVDDSVSGFAVVGNTYKYKESLKAEGARWDPDRKAWIFTDMEMLNTVQTRFSIKELRA
eukprot:scaffold140_cov163-Amphora_coffeaeformis.AAC.7